MSPRVGSTAYARRGRRVRSWASLAGLGALAALAACTGDTAITEPAPALKSGGASAPLRASPSRLTYTLPPGTAATLTATVQYVGPITAQSSDATGCATVSPTSVPASKPAGSSVYVATFTVTPVAVGACTITLRDKKGQQVQVPVRVEGAVSGGRIAFTSVRDGNAEIYLIGASGPVRVTNNDFRDLDPVLSPDGQKIAFSSSRDGNHDIYIMNADGSDQVRLTSHPAGDIQPAFSPDGSKLAFASYRVDSDAGLNELVTDLYVMNADGTDQQRLTFFDHSRDAGSPRYSPDGVSIVFASAFQIWRIGADGSNPVQLMAEGDNFSPSYSPDGQQIVYAGNPLGGFSDVYVMNADGSNPQRLTTTATGAGTPTFSPDGARIAFASTRSGNDDVYLIQADGTGEVRLTADAALDAQPRFGP
jgi:WD40 repeat protein